MTNSSTSNASTGRRAGTLLLWLSMMLLAFGARAGSGELRYGMLADFPPYQLWPEGASPGGADLELLRQLAPQLGVTLQPVRYSDFHQLEADLRAGRIDIASSMASTPVRTAVLPFSRPYTRLKQALLTRADAPIGALAPDLTGRSIAIVSGTAGADNADSLFPLAPRVVVDSVQAAIDAVVSGRADATLQALSVLVDLVERQRLVGLQVARTFELPSGALHFAFAPARRDTAKALTALLVQQPAANFEAILQRWSLRSTLLRPAGGLAIGPDDRQALARLAPLKVALAGDERPFAFIGEDDQATGLDVDALTAVLSRLGLPAPSWQRLDGEALATALRQGQVDLVVGLDENAAWADTLRFIGPVIEHPMVLIGRREGAAYDLGQLSGRRLALPPSHFGRPLIESRYGSIELVDCTALVACIDRVTRGDADATLADVVGAALRLAERPQADLQIVGVVEGLRRTHSIGVAVRHAALVPLFKSALDDAVVADMPAIKARWLGRPSPAEVVRRVLRQALPWIAAALVLLFAAWWWHSSALRRQVRRTRAAQQVAERARGGSERFVAFLAHEVRNSLHSVIAGAELLRSARQVTPAIATSLGDSARSTLSLLNNLLDRDRLEAGRLSLHLEPARLEPLLKAVTVEMLPAALARQLALQPVALASDPLLRIDTLRVQQLVRNLVANAIKYSHRGAITITGRCDAVADDPRRCVVELRVQDQGPGISREDQAHLFERYYVVGGAASAQGSTGLGLPLCRDIARLMGGDLSIESEPGRGTTAVLRWPAEALELAPVAPSVLVPRRFLLVEDAEVYAMLLDRALTVQGLPVAVAGSVQRARELLAQQAFDVVLTDLNLGDGDAHAVIAAVLASTVVSGAGRGTRPTIIVMSAEIDERQLRALRESGAQAVLKKSGDVALFVRQLLPHPALQMAVNAESGVGDLVRKP